MPTPTEKLAALQSQPGVSVQIPGNSAKIEPESASNTAGVVEADTATASESKTPSPKEDPKIASQFAALAKKEKAIVRQAQEIKSKESSFAEREKAIAAREAKIKESEALWETDVFKALELRGYDYQKLTRLQLDGQTAAPKVALDPEKAVAKALEDFQKRQDEKEAAQKAEQEKYSAQQAEAQKQQLEQAYANYRSEVEKFVKANSDTYELTSLYDQTDLIVDTVQEYFDNYDKVLSIKEATEMVEKYLDNEAQKVMKTKKFGKASAPAAKVEDKKTTPSKTLSNQLSPSMSSNLPAANESDRMKRALAKLT